MITFRTMKINIKNKKFKRYLYYIALFIILILFIVFFFDMIKSVFLTLFLVIIASLSKIYKRILGYAIGFELVTICTIIFLFTHNPVVAFLLSMLMLVASTLISGRVSQNLPIQASLYILITFLALFMQGFNIVLASKILLILYNIFLHSVSLLFLRFPLHSSIIIIIVHLTTGFIFIDLFAVWLQSNI